MVEQHTVEALEGAKVRVTFWVAGDNTASEYQKVVKKYAKSIDLKGFRKGKVPVHLLERKFGKELRTETFHEILTQCTKEILPNVEPKPLPYSSPYLCDPEGKELAEAAASSLNNTFRPGQPLEFAVGFDTAPEVPLATLEGLQFEAITVVISDEDVGKEIEQLRKQNGVMVERKGEVGAADDIMSIRFALLAEGQTEPVEEAKLRNIVRLGEADVHGFHDEVKTLKSGEVKILKGHSFADGESVEETLRGKNGDVWVEVSSIRTRDLPELNDDFAQDIDENYQTLDDLKKSIGAKLEHEAEHLLENYDLQQIYRYWVDSLDFAIPRTMVEYQTHSMMDNIKQRMGGNDQGVMMYLGMQHGGDVQKGFGEVEKEALLGLFVNLVREKLLKSKDWQATSEDIDRELEHMARHHGITESELQERYKDQWEQVQEHLGQAALFSRLSRNLVSEARSKSAGSVELMVSELKEKLGELEADCHDAVSQKFLPYKEEQTLPYAADEAYAT